MLKKQKLEFVTNLLMEFIKKKQCVYRDTWQKKTSLNTVVHENVKVYTNQYVKFFLKFP